MRLIVGASIRERVALEPRMSSGGTGKRLSSGRRVKQSARYVDAVMLRGEKRDRRHTPPAQTNPAAWASASSQS